MVKLLLLVLADCELATEGKEWGTDTFGNSLPHKTNIWTSKTSIYVFTVVQLALGGLSDIATTLVHTHRILQTLMEIWCKCLENL